MRRVHALASLRLPACVRRTLVVATGVWIASLVAPAGAQTAASPAPGASADVPRVELDKLKRPAPSAPPSNLFGSRSWEPKAAPRKAAPAPPPPPPQAPPLPFTYLGRWIERGETTVMIGREGRNYTVREGEQVDASYRLEKIDADRLVFRYVPLDQTQVLPFAAPPPTVAQPGPGVQQLTPLQRRGAAPRDADDEED